MKLKDLSDLAYVVEQAKVVLNTGSTNRHPKEKIHDLKRKIYQLESQFLDGFLSLTSLPTAEPTPSSPSPLTMMQDGAVVFVPPVTADAKAEPASASTTVMTGPAGEKLVVSNSLDVPTSPVGGKLTPETSPDVPVSSVGGKLTPETSPDVPVSSVGGKLTPDTSPDVPIASTTAKVTAQFDPEIVEALTKAKANLSKRAKK